MPNSKVFNDRTQRSKVGSGWAHDSSQYHFLRVSPHDHRSIPFAEAPTGSKWDGVAAVALIGMVGLLVLLPWIIEWVDK